jgi:hypothetical protein
MATALVLKAAGCCDKIMPQDKTLEAAFQPEAITAPARRTDQVGNRTVPDRRNMDPTRDLW